MKLYFNDKTQYILVDIDPDFYEHYGEVNSGYFIPITRQDNLQRGLFGVMLIPDDDEMEDNIRHEAVHAAAAWVRVHGYIESEEEAIAVIQDELMQAWSKYDNT